ncbi:MAG: YggS family pyridoxal phosphate-dependent enzyme [Firmicutes bacterium]|nr:YggS family pyridoxal phosphate-dependent enzyme [Bacillota bacterium]
MIEKIAENISVIQNKIAAAQARSVYAAKQVQLLAVSKTYPIERVRDAVAAGQRAFGENRVQELVEKFEHCPDLEWHLIGHLQTNKVKYLIGKTCLIHSLDSMELAQEIEKRSAAQDVQTNVLVQLNIAKEDTKSGLMEDELADFLDAVCAFPHVHLSGLMTIGPNVEDASAIRSVFARLRQLRDAQQQILRPNCDLSLLSMGMSGDYEIAVEEGANIVRVGSAIFGQRVYS